MPFPESVAASEVHKAGQSGAKAAKYLFYNIGDRRGRLPGRRIRRVTRRTRTSSSTSDRWDAARCGWARSDRRRSLGAGGVTTVAGPTVSPAFLGVGYIIGPELAALNFSGSVVAWGLLIPLLIFFLGPQLNAFLPAGAQA